MTKNIWYVSSVEGDVRAVAMPNRPLLETIELCGLLRSLGGVWFSLLNFSHLNLVLFNHFLPKHYD